MTRQEAIELACRHAKAQPQSYYSEPFQPHEWVIAAIVEASCDHDWEVIDDSFSHEFGTEVIVYNCCKECGAVQDYEPADFE